ncbi:MAG: acyl carrier protein [Ktedonobacterales bacterium]
MNNQLGTTDIDLIGEQVRDFVRTNFLFSNTATVEDNTSLIEYGIIDETGALELVMFVEETYGFQVEESDLVPENFDTIASVSAYVARRLAGQGGDASTTDEG